jgi:hypothetical protein
MANLIENSGLCTHVQFSRESRGYPGSAEQWEAYLAAGGLAITTRLLAREHADCAQCGALLAVLESEVQS